MQYPLATDSWGPEEIAALHEVIASGRFTMGERVAAFERAFAEHVGSPYAVMVNSGSSANLLMAAALTLRGERPLAPGDEVVVPAVSWPTTYYPFSQYGLKLRFVDIDASTLNYDLAALEATVSPATRAVVAVNLLGNPNDFDAVAAICDRVGAVLVEDNCESLGATYRGRQTGTFGVMGTYSFYFSHHISTMEGGMVVTSDEELHHILLSIRSHGWTRHLPDVNRLTGRKSDDPFEESFKFVLPGYNVRPLEMEAAVGMQQLKKLPDFIAQRRRNAELFRAAVAPHAERVAIQEEIGQSSWFGFSLVLRDRADDRRHLVRALADAGIESRPIVTGNFARSAVIPRMNVAEIGELPNADLIDSHGLFIGNQERSLEAEIDHFATVLGEVWA